MTTIQYVGVPTDVKREVVEILRRFRCAMPGWLNKLTVEYAIRPDETMGAAIAAITVQYEYRHATVRIYGNEWSRPDVDHERVIVHELMHCHIAPIEKLAHTLLDKMEEAYANDATDPLLLAMTEQARIAMESAVEDAAQAVIAARYADG